MSLSKPLPVEKHTIETLRVYPRVHYFQRRYHDLVPRFKRVTGSFPKSFQVEKLIKKIDDINDKFTKKLDICVIGNCELDLAHIVVSTKPSEKEMFSELKEPSRMSLFICCSKSEKLDQSGLKSITSVIDKFCEDFGKENPHLFEYMFVVIETEQNHSDEERNTFRKEVNEIIRVKLQDTDVQPRPDRIIFGSNDTVLGSKISELLETMPVDGFHTVTAYLDRFVRKTKQYDSEIDIIHTDLLVKSIQAFLRDDIGLADMRQIAENDHSKETEGMSVDEKFLQQLLKKLARLVKCAVVEPCASKYNIPPWVVNLLLDEIQFEQKLAESVSKNTRHHLRKLNEITKDYEGIVKTHKRKANMGRGKHGASQHEYFIRFVSYKFDFIVYPLQNDMSKVISDAEKTMASASHIITVMGKMMFEIEGYLEQTITEKYEPKAPTPDVPKDLRDAILELKEVYGTGKVYDVFEIHVQEQTPTLKEDVSTLMRKYGYTQPYKVKTVTKETVKMMADIQHENGKLIKSPFPGNRTKYREGTLGCFAENDLKKLYVLTCAHVVENHMPIVDIAAVTVNDDFERQCIRRMKDESGLNRTSVIAMEPVTQLYKRVVYKHAAKSGLTKGIICSSEFYLSGTCDDVYLLMIESLPGSDSGCFAESGDSVNTDDIKVVAMLNGGDYKVAGGDTEEKYLSFFLRKGLQKLKDQSNVLLHIPNTEVSPGKGKYPDRDGSEDRITRQRTSGNHPMSFGGFNFERSPSKRNSPKKTFPKPRTSTKSSPRTVSNRSIESTSGTSSTQSSSSTPLAIHSTHSASCSNEINSGLNVTDNCSDSFSNDNTPLQSRSYTISSNGYAESNQSPVYNGSPGLVSNNVPTVCVEVSSPAQTRTKSTTCKTALNFDNANSNLNNANPATNSVDDSVRSGQVGNVSNEELADIDNGYTEMKADVEKMLNEIDQFLKETLPDEKKVFHHKASQTVPTVVKFASPNEVDC